MAIYRLLQRSAFGPGEIGFMTTAYEDALRVLGISNRTDPTAEIVAKKVIEIAQTGERAPLGIRVRAIAELGLSNREDHLTKTTDPVGASCR